MDPLPFYAVTPAAAVAVFAPVYSRVLLKFLTPFTEKKSSNPYAEFSALEERVVRNAIVAPTYSSVFGGIVGASLSPLILNLGLHLIKLRSPSILSFAAALGGGYLGIKSGLAASASPALEPLLALPAESKVRQRVIQLLEEEAPEGMYTPLYQLYGSKALPSSSK